jgi:hypothetical protein
MTRRERPQCRRRSSSSLDRQRVVGQCPTGTLRLCWPVTTKVGAVTVGRLL